MLQYTQTTQTPLIMLCQCGGPGGAKWGMGTAVRESGALFVWRWDGFLKFHQFQNQSVTVGAFSVPLCTLRSERCEAPVLILFFTLHGLFSRILPSRKSTCPRHAHTLCLSRRFSVLVRSCGWVEFKNYSTCYHLSDR